MINPVELICIQKHISCAPGTKGRNKGEFTNLQGVAASSQGKVLIADSNNQCVQVKGFYFSCPAGKRLYFFYLLLIYFLLNCQRLSAVAF